MHVFFLFCLTNFTSPKGAPLCKPASGVAAYWAVPLGPASKQPKMGIPEVVGYDIIIPQPTISGCCILLLASQALFLPRL